MTPPTSVTEFFDELYASPDRYWWRESTRYATDADAHPYSLVTQMTLRLIASRRPGRALDLGAGEGADSIRLALLGYQVTAVEISKVAADKIARFAADMNVVVDVQVADICGYQPDGEFDLVISNGVLHYVAEKRPVVRRMQRATKNGGLNVVSLWSTRTEVPDCHNSVPVFCDAEDGEIAELYRDWAKELYYFERDKPEKSHGEMPRHSHSHIKLIARKPG